MKAAHVAALPLLLVLSSTSSAQDVEPTVPIVTQEDARSHGLESLFTLRREEGLPLPENLGEFVKNGRIATMLGKALFFEMGVGSDGIQSCATCHFHAGADSRFRNQVSPGLLRHAGEREGPGRRCGRRRGPLAPCRGARRVRRAGGYRESRR
jgi:cytochrome c peroxidase